MAKLNTKATGIVSVPLEDITVNEEGAVAYIYTATNRLIERTLGAFWNENLFYAKGSKQTDGLIKDIKTVAKTDPKFILQLAAYARNEMYMRTTPQVLLVQAANIEACKPFVREYTPKIVKRADELSEVIAYQLTTFGKPIPNSLKKGLAAAFAKFDEYQLNKYDSDKNTVKLADVLHLIYRKKDYPVSQAMYNFLVNDIVDNEALPKISAYKRLMAKTSLDEEAEELIKVSNVTWESLISKFGSTKENWERVIPNMGYMALLRNLRNFEEKKVQLEPVIERLVDPNQVKRSKQLPFRFFSAYQNTTNQTVKRAIAKAFELSVDNVSLSGKTGILVDTSGSMSSQLSDKSNVQYVQVGAVLAALAVKKSAESVIVPFASFARTVSLNPDDTMITNMQEILRIGSTLGGGTNATAGFREIIKNTDLDRIIIISDMQCYGRSGWSDESDIRGGWNEYRKNNRNAFLYSWDISAYGTSQVPTVDNNAMQLFGWSDKILDYISLSERKASLDSEIRKW